MNLTFEKLLWRGGGGNDLSFLRRGWVGGWGVGLFLRLGRGPSPGGQSEKPLVFLARVPSGKSLSLHMHTTGKMGELMGCRWSGLQHRKVRTFYPPFNSYPPHPPYTHPCLSSSKSALLAWAHQNMAVDLERRFCSW